MQDGVIITPLHAVAKDERGSSYAYHLKNRSDFVFLTRKAGSTSGNTYHKGKSAGTNPKTIVLLVGEMEFSYRHIDESACHVVKIEKPSIIEVSPRITHAVKAVTDIHFLECNSLAEIQRDRHRELVDSTDSCN
jgi:hypothetical protein